MYSVPGDVLLLCKFQLNDLEMRPAHCNIQAECQRTDWQRHKSEPCLPYDDLVGDDSLWTRYGIRKGTGDPTFSEMDYSWKPAVWMYALSAAETYMLLRLRCNVRLQFDATKKNW